MATVSIANFDLTIIDNSVFATNNLRKQHKRANLDKIYNKLIKAIDSENTSKDQFPERIIIWFVYNFSRKAYKQTK